MRLPDDFLAVVYDIKSLKIQGAENIAKAAVEAFVHLAKTGPGYLPKGYELLITARATEPALRNALYMLWWDKTLDAQEIITRSKSVLDHFRSVAVILPKIGAEKIKKKMSIYTHCHSSAVVSVILAAHVQKKQISVLNTETRPRFQGRKTAQEVARHGIVVHHYVDSAMRQCLKKADIVLLGADAIDTQMRVYNKIGSELVAMTAYEYEVPVYICTDSWKFTPKAEEVIEERSSDEIWEKPPKNIIIHNMAFEKINPKYIQGIICEFGIFTPAEFVSQVRKKYPALFT